MKSENWDENENGSGRLHVNVGLMFLENVLELKLRSDNLDDTAKYEDVEENDTNNWNGKKKDAVTRIHPAHFVLIILTEKRVNRNNKAWKDPSNEEQVPKF